MYKVSELDINATVNDFTVFCNYVEEKKPVLSKRKAVLGKNDLYELNSLLFYKKEVASPNFQQESYPIIDLIFNLALLGKLYVKAADAKGNVYLTRTTSKDEFDVLNIYEKYAFILETFWTKYDLEGIMRWGMGTSHIDNAIQTLADSVAGEELEKGAFSQRTEYDVLFSYLSVVIRYFNYFGFCRYIPIIEINKKITKYDDSIKAVIPTELGVNICKVLVGQKIVDWNIPWLKELIMDEKDIIPGIPYQSKFALFPSFSNKKEKLKAEKVYDERRKSGFIPLYKFLEPIVPEGALNKTVTAVRNKLVKGSYVFKVSLGRSVWRKIMLSYDHTLEELHNAVQEAFDFEDDHLYSFFMDAKRYSKHAYHSPMCDEGPFANDVRIGELGLYEGQKIIYLFDYGDSWEFEVQLLKIFKDEIPPKNPKIIEAKGEAPRQYEYCDDDDDEWEEGLTWSDSYEQDERIKKVVGDIADEDYITAFEAWEVYFKTILKLPFDAEVSEYQERGALKCGDKVVVKAFESIEDPYGIVVKIIAGKKEYYFPLCDLKAIDEKSVNYEPLFDYAVWFANR
jgi:hypothetical protein